MKKLTRREFIKTSVIVGGSVYLGGCHLFEAKGDVPLYIMGAAASDPIETTVGIENVYSICQMCEGNCGLRARIREGTVIKLDGNPYHPNSMEPHIPYSTDPKEALQYSGSLCVKGQAGIQTLYDPFRIKTPLKRIGSRGSGKWQSITWDKAIEEIVQGGDLFNEGQVEGLRGIRDTKVLIDDRSPELGVKANQFVFLSGTLDLGSRSFISRFMNAYGSINGGTEDTSIRQSSYRAGFQLSLNDDYDSMKPDILNSRFLIFFGSSPLESSVPVQTVVRKMMKANVGAQGGSESLQQQGYRKEFEDKYGRLKWVVVDPRLSSSASMADQWIAIKPCTDAALALGMMRWMMDNNAYDSRFLQNTTKKAAAIDGHKSWTNATYLVRLDNMELLRARDAGLKGQGDKYVVWNDGKPRGFDQVDHGQLEVKARIRNIPCKSVFLLLKERVCEKDIREYGKICGVTPSVIEKLAEEFTSYGKQAVADFYGGAVQHTNGTYTARTIIVLNFLIGNIDAKGGLIGGGGSWDSIGGRDLLADLKDVSKSTKLSGIRIDRAGHRYEDTTEFKNRGYPSKRPWFPFASDWGNFQEVIPSIADRYPYPVKALFLYRANPSYSAPAMREIVKDSLKDTRIVPLVVGIDSEITETNTFADYILPDTTYLERWDICKGSSVVTNQTIGIRRPVIGNFDPKTGVYKPIIPTTMVMEDILIRLAKKMGLPGFGGHGFGIGAPLNTAWDFYKRAISHLVKNSEDGVLSSLGETQRIEYALLRGGSFESYDKAYKGNHTGRVYGGLCQIFNEKLQKSNDSMTGEPFDGLPRYEPIMDITGKDIKDSSYPLQLISYRFVFDSRMRTAGNRWLLEVMPENSILINPVDARAIGVKTGDQVKIESPNSKGIIGKTVISEGIRPGVVGIPYGFGRWGIGANTINIDGESIESDSTRGAGVPLTPLLRVDPTLKNVCLQDKIGANASFNDTRVRVVKISRDTL
ncbi:MAG: molybdopterin-dependent oxidoreductase [Thermodesulfobacteriota bacterium]|nr:molybdopterin-dependent oxidoreductase [Thermodesulfobacteriota bacterium]